MRTAGERRRAVALVLVATLAGGCFTSAAIERRSGPTIVGRIESSDPYRLYVRGDDGMPYAIERWDVVDIDHPGKVGRVVGGIFTGVGAIFLLMAATTDNNCSTSESDFCFDIRPVFTFIGITNLLIGVPIWIYNQSVRSRSQAAAWPAPPPAASELPSRGQ
jgi:hypothetical protein